MHIFTFVRTQTYRQCLGAGDFVGFVFISRVLHLLVRQGTTQHVHNVVHDVLCELAVHCQILPNVVHITAQKQSRTTLSRNLFRNRYFRRFSNLLNISCLFFSMKKSEMFHLAKKWAKNSRTVPRLWSTIAPFLLYQKILFHYLCWLVMLMMIYKIFYFTVELAYNGHVYNGYRL